MHPETARGLRKAGLILLVCAGVLLPLGIVVAAKTQWEILGKGERRDICVDCSLIREGRYWYLAGIKTPKMWRAVPSRFSPVFAGDETCRSHRFRELTSRESALTLSPGLSVNCRMHFFPFSRIEESGRFEQAFLEIAQTNRQRAKEIWLQLVPSNPSQNNDDTHVLSEMIQANSSASNVKAFLETHFQ